MVHKTCCVAALIGLALFVGCRKAPVSAPNAEEASAGATPSVEENAPTEEMEPAIPVSQTIAAWEKVGAKFVFDTVDTLKSADFSETTGSPAFDESESDRWKTLRVLRGKGDFSLLLADQAARAADLTECLWNEAIITPEALSRLGNLPKLKKLRLTGAEVPSIGSILATFPALTELDLSGASINADDLLALAELKTLARLNLYRTSTGDQGVHALRPLAGQIVWLNLDDTQITDAVGPDLAEFKKLNFLHIGRTDTTDALVDWLARQTDLETIHITRTGITEEGAARLRRALPETEVISEVRER
ncbi:MAG: leucine-rich repeat domain-containing protein [Thermoguttaceae bacterium]|jgi:hypothetical protein